MESVEVNFEGVAGPTYSFSGLSKDNYHSQLNTKKTSNPRLAALQGLKKSFLLSQLGVVQGIVPPQERPLTRVLMELGYRGKECNIIDKVFKDSPELLSQCFSSSSVWVANSATVSPSYDSTNNKLNITIANLNHHFHRSLESCETERLFAYIFKDKRFFNVNKCLPKHEVYKDEGAANHMRICEAYDSMGIQIFVYGENANKGVNRQTYEASKSIAKLNHVLEKNVIFVPQNTEAANYGAFHNDVLCLNNKNVIVFHERAFKNTSQFISELTKKFSGKLHYIIAKEEDVPLSMAIDSFVFNSQLISSSKEEMDLIVPNNCFEHAQLERFIQRILNEENPISSIHYVDLSESLNNGGGPSCVRVRVVMNNQSLNALEGECILTPEKYTELCDWVNKNYRDQLCFNDFRDPLFLDEIRTALDELTKILKLPSIYSFQK